MTSSPTSGHQPWGQESWNESQPSRVPKNYLWSKYECFLMSGCRDMNFWKNLEIKLCRSVTGTRMRTWMTGVTAIALLVLRTGELTRHYLAPLNVIFHVTNNEWFQNPFIPSVPWKRILASRIDQNWKQKSTKSDKGQHYLLTISEKNGNDSINDWLSWRAHCNWFNYKTLQLFFMKMWVIIGQADRDTH